MTVALARPALAQHLGETSLGAALQGNRAGTIPAWTGGLRAVPGDGSDPFAADPVLELLGAANADDPRLTPGLAALLRARPGLQIRVMQSRRSAALPDFILRATEANATRASLASDGNGVIGAATGIPFPHPRNGIEAIWNHMLRWRFVAIERNVAFAAPQASGAFALGRLLDRTLYPYNRPDLPPDGAEASQLLTYILTAPPAYSRLALLSVQPLDFSRASTRYWFYTPSNKRVALSADTAFDTPNSLVDGLRTVDQADMFAGSPERYDWALLGKREAIVPYNSYALQDRRRRYSEVLRPGGLDPALTRYELHRVWVVDAKLKSGRTHRYARRVFYIDEDSWQVLLVDQYDANGDLRRVSEAHPIQYGAPLSFYAGLDVVHDLRSGRYAVFGLPNEEPPANTEARLIEADFTPSAFRALVSR